MARKRASAKSKKKTTATKVPAKKTTATQRTTATKVPAARAPKVRAGQEPLRRDELRGFREEVAGGLAVGAAAPPFDLADQTGARVRLADLRGRPVVLYFYPKDDTPGCTVEACDLRDRHAALQAAGAVVLGVSRDGAASHAKFIQKHALPFQLLVDADHAVMERYGAWGEKVLYGKRSLGTIRSTVLVDREGRVARVWPKVKVAGHAQEVLEAVQAL